VSITPTPASPAVAEGVATGAWRLDAARSSIDFRVKVSR
jgi:polyisoprenoid-binding protein YceI